MSLRRSATIFATPLPGPLLLVALACAACAGAPRPQPVRPIAQRELHAPLLPADPALLAYLRVRDPIGLLGKLSLEGAARALQGWHTEELRQDGIVALFAFEPADKPLGEAPLYGLFPTAPTTQLGQQLKAAAGEVSPLGDGTVAALNGRAELDPARLQELSWLASQPLVENAQLVVNVGPLLRYRPALEKWWEAIISSPKGRVAAGTPPKDKPARTGFGTPLRAMFEQLEALRSSTLGVSVDDKGIELSVIAEGKLKEPPLETAELLGFLDDGDLTGRFDASEDAQRMMHSYRQFIAAFFSDEPAIRAKFEEALNDQPYAAGAHAALSFEFGEYGTRGFFLWQLRPGVDARAVTLKWMTASGELASRQGAEGKPAINIKAQRAIRKRRGFEIDRYDIESLKKPNDGEASYGYSTETAQVGPYFVTAIHQPPAAMDRLIDALVDGKPARAAPPAPQGTFVSGQIHLARIVNELARLGPAHTRGNFDERLPRATFDGVESGSVTRYRLQIPPELVAAVRALNKRAAARQVPGG